MLSIKGIEKGSIISTKTQIQRVPISTFYEIFIKFIIKIGMM